MTDKNNKIPVGVFAFTPFRIGLLVVIFSCLLYYSFSAKPALIEATDNSLVDAMFKWRGPQATTGEVVIVDLDEKSLAALGQWPWSRTIVARIVKNITKAGAKVIAFDIVFAEQDRTSPIHTLPALQPILPEVLTPDAVAQLQNKAELNYDIVLGDAVATGDVVLGYTFQTLDDGLKNKAATPFPSNLLRMEPEGVVYEEIQFIQAYRAITNVVDIAQSKTEGFFDVFPDATGTVRKVPLFMTLDGIPYPSLPLEIFRLGIGAVETTIHASPHNKKGKRGILGVTVGNRFIPTDDNGQVTVNFRGSVGSFPYISAIDVFQEIDLEKFKNKYVIIGTSAAGLLDLRATPFSNVFPGVEVHATIVDNFLKNDPFSYDILTEKGLTYTIIIIGGVLLSALLAFSSPLIGGFGGMTFIFFFLLYGNYAVFFESNRLVGVTYPLLTIMGVFAVVLVFNYFFEGKKKRFIQGAFSHYVSPHVVAALVKNPQKLSLAGEQRIVTIFFSDIRGFTSISEKMDSAELGRFMNEYLTAMSTIVIEHNGTVDKYIGDAIMAIWGAPLDDDQHATRAVQASLAMIEKLKELRLVWGKKNLPYIDIGIGLNTGMVSVGNFGSYQRFDYTVIGDHVNLASRLEGSNKAYGTNIILSEFTRKAVGDTFFCRFVDLVRMKGKKEPVRIYEPLVMGKPDAALKQEVARYEEAITFYQQREFDSARSILTELHQARPLALYNLYLERIRQFQAAPPPAEWDGVFTFTTK